MFSLHRAGQDYSGNLAGTTVSGLPSQEQTMGGVVLRLNIVHLRVREMLLYQNALGSIEMVEIG